jgi:hypothetical protein
MTHTLFYKARATGNMWDTWLYWHAGVCYLFHLAGRGGTWHGVAMATSPDGVHWREHGLVLEKAAGVTWLGTGSVWERPAGSGEPRFILNFSEWRGDAQTIFFADSDDLLHWRRLGDETEFRPDGRWYNTGGGNDGRWDCIYTIDRPGGGRYGYWTANPLGFTGFGFGESEDGVAWRCLPPPHIDWGDVAPLPVVESGAVAEIDGRCYTMLGTYQPYRHYSSGMFAFVADAPAGPFRPIATNFALLASPAGRWHTYFARFFPLHDALLVNHHAIAADGEVWMAPLKRAVVDAAGALRLMWWPGNDVVKGAWQATTHAGAAPGDAIAYAPSDGLLVEGLLDLPGGLAEEPPTFGVACGEGKQAIQFRVLPGGVVDIDETAADGGARPLERVDRALGLAGAVPFRLLLMHSFAELYLADHLIQVISLPAAPAGRLTLAGARPGWRSWQPPGRA